MSKFIKQIGSFLMACTEACYAAHLARNGQHTRAKNLYK